MEAKTAVIDPTYTKYVNFPSCSNPNWAEKYWGDVVSTLQTIKSEWDPDNLFNHCQSIGSSPVSGQDCFLSLTQSLKLLQGKFKKWISDRLIIFFFLMFYPNRNIST